MDARSGATVLRVRDRAHTTLRVDGGSGAVTVHLPTSEPVRIGVEHVGSGGIELPDGLTRVAGRADGDTGVWESPDWGQTPRRVRLALTGGSGCLKVR